MKHRSWALSTALALTLAAQAARAASPADGRDGVGPDLVISDLLDLIHWGAVGTIQAYSLGTYGCNFGDAPAAWDGSTDQHPLIGQNMFRYSAGRFEQIGQSWPKWAYIADNGAGCGDCIDPNTGTLLGVNCGDPYEALWNGYQPRLGPKSTVNPFTGEFPVTHASPTGGTTIGGRLQVRNPDLATSGALYFLEGQLIAPDDAAAGNALNNVSYRQVWVLGSRDLTWSSPLGAASTTVAAQPAIAAWKALDPAVFLSFVDVPGDGRIYIGRRVVSLGAGLWHYDIAIQNVNADRAVGGLRIALPAGHNAANLGFHAVEYHSGEIYDATPWPGVADADGVHWETTPFSTNANANALRWGTLYNFWFDAAVAPANVAVAELALFKPGLPADLRVQIGPAAALAGDLNCDRRVDFGDINPFIAALANSGEYGALFPNCRWLNADCNGDSVVDVGDVNPFVALIVQGAGGA
jgi:hypothetical protein